MKSKQKILIVEDEAHIAEVLIAYCHNNGYETHHLSSGGGVIDYIKANQVDLMLLDLMLPDVDGFEICKQLRLFSQLPVIMLTAKAEEIDRLFGLEFGADDYICKPFSPREVIARIKAVLRRFDNNVAAQTNTQLNTNDHIIKQSGFELDSEKYKVTFRGDFLDLTPIEFKILELFLKNIERVFTRNEIMNQVYLDTVDVSDRNIDTHIKNIRKKINLISSDSNPICSVYGVGYKCEKQTSK